MIELIHRIDEMSRSLRRLAGSVTLFTDLVIEALKSNAALEARVKRLEEEQKEKE